MERLLQDIIDMLPVGVLVADAQGHLIRKNPAAERIWSNAYLGGVDELDLSSAWWVGTDKPIAPDEWGIARAIQHGETSVGELIRIQCFDGTSKFILASAAPLYDHSGKLTGAVAINEDVTAQQEAEQHSHHREQLLNTVFGLLPVGVWGLDASGNITLANSAGDRIWGKHDWRVLADFSELKAWDAASDEPIAPGDSAVFRALRKGVTSREELLCIEAMDGSRKTIINWAAPILGESGEVTGAIAVSEDVSALYRVQEQLRAAVRDREEILAIVAHDLRNPLGSIMVAASTAQTLASKLRGGEKLRDRMTVLAELARNMAGLVDDLLAVSVTTAGGTSMLKFQQVAPAKLIQGAYEDVSALYEASGVELRRDVDPGLPDIQADPQRLRRVLVNLLDNALKYTDARGTVILSAKAQAAVVGFSVTNSGAALTGKQRRAMFEPFWQSSRANRGAGLGMSICRSIIEAHGGSIWAEAAGGQRVRIAFQVPLTQGVLTQSAATIPADDLP